MWKALRQFSRIIAFATTTAPLAHVLELRNKLSLDGPLWLDIQRTLYIGWGPVFGAVEVFALLASLSLIFRPRTGHAPYIVATFCYAAMIAVFFLFNDPVNRAVLQWTSPGMLPANWADYRLKWETGHALAAVLSLIAFAALLRSRDEDTAAP